MFRISKDSPAYYLTSVAKDRLPAFRGTTLKELVCRALDEARHSAGLLIFAYALMPDHLHMIVGSGLKPSKVLQYINGIVSRRVIDFLKAGGYKLSLQKLQHADRGHGYQYSLWEHHANARLLTTEDVFMQKINYVHQNPVRAHLVNRAEDYRWSSVRCWARRAAEDEPLTVDIDQIAWRQARHSLAK